MSSIGITTLGMFDQGVGSGGNAAAGIIHIDETKPKPNVKVITIISKEKDSKNKIEVTSITSGD